VIQPRSRSMLSRFSLPSLPPSLAPSLALLAAGALLAPAPAGAQVASAPAVAAVTYDSSALAALGWREIGPYRGGRSVAVAGSVARKNEYWMGTTGGGVFKSTDGGMNWSPASDGYFGGTIGAIAVDERNPDVVWVGGGETPIRGNVSHGDGVWRTANAGKTWTFMGLAETRQIARVRIHPRDPNTVYVAALGNVFAPTAERGIYRTTDAGKTWEKILFRNDSTGAIDLVLDPSNPDVMYAAFWQAGRTPWTLSSGGAGSGIFKTTDAGRTWTEISRNPGMPAGLMGKIGIAVSPAKPDRVWALVENDSGGVFRSDDGGATWQRTNSERSLRQRAWYYSRLFADPADSNVVYALNVGFFRSRDGGKTFTTIPVPHGDNHDLWIASDDAERMIEGNDGGANVSVNGGRAWTDQDYATAQMYHVTTTNEFPYNICGAQQDNSTLCGPSRAAGGIAMKDWYDAGGCESGYIAADPRNPDITYAGCYGGNLERSDRRTGLSRNVSPWPLNPMGHSSDDIKYRFQWTFPIVFSRHDPQTLYAGGSQLFRTTNEGQSWEIVSPVLAKADPKTMGPSGGPITKDQTGVETYAVIFAFDESPVRAGLLWAGTDDGMIHLSQDNAKTWRNVTPDLPPFARISIIEPSPHDAGTAYVAANRYQMNDLRPYLLKTTDYGRTWTRIDAGLPATEFTRVIREDPVRRGLLYAGTERGVWTSFDDGRSWQSLRRNLPLVPVHDLVVKEGDLVVATHGRSFYVMDDITPLRQLTPAVVAKSAHLFTPRAAYRVQWGGGRGAGTVGQNPASGAVVHYWLKAPNQTVTLDFLDARGTVIRSFTSAQDSASAADSVRRETMTATRRDSLLKSGLAKDSVDKLLAPAPGERRGGAPGAGRPPRVANKAGLNSFAWNLRYSDASTFEGLIMWAGSTAGPVAPPGTYRVRLTAGGQTQTQTFEVKKDPRSSAMTADLAQQFEFLLQIRDRVSQANDAVKTIRNARWQVDERLSKLRGADSARVAALGATMRARLGAVEETIYQVRNQSNQDPLNYPIRLNNEIAALTGHVASAEAKPTAQSRQVFAELSARLDTQLALLQREMAATLAPVNAELTRLGQVAIAPQPVDPPRASATEADAGSGDDATEGEEEH